MAGKIWTDIEEKILIENYAKCSRKELLDMLPTRTWAAIKLHASQLNVKYYKGVHEHVKANLRMLLENSPEALYWMGFLAADGYFHNNRLRLVLSIKDMSQVIAFCKFIGCPKHNKMGKDAYGMAVKDSFTIPKILKKYDLKKAKTYNPPNISEIDLDHCVYFFIGFVDGDGSIGKQSKRQDCLLRIKIHSSWKETLQNLVDKVCLKAGVKAPKVIINKQGYACVNLANSVLLKFLKRKAVEAKLPVLARKWDQIDDTKVSRVEQATENRNQVIRLLKAGLRNVEISKQTGLSQATVSVIIKAFNK
jgi:hypothetical protein